MELCAEVLMGLGSAVPRSIDDDLDCRSLEMPDRAIRWMTAGFFMDSPDDNLVPGASSLKSDDCPLPAVLWGLLPGFMAFSELPSRLGLSPPFLDRPVLFGWMTSYRLEVAGVGA